MIEEVTSSPGVALNLYAQHQRDVNDVYGLGVSDSEIMEVAAVLSAEIEAGLIRVWLAGNGSPVGMVLLDLGTPGHRRGEVRGLYVAPDARRTGVGSSLVDVALGEAERGGYAPVATIRDTNHVVQEMFSRRGWVKGAPSGTGASWWHQSGASRRDSLA